MEIMIFFKTFTVVSSLDASTVVHRSANRANEGNNYDKYRPDYTDDDVQTVIDMLGIQQTTGVTANSSKIVELGSGTGKFTGKIKPLLPKNVEYIATDPLRDFLSTLENKYPETKTLQCTAESIPVDSLSLQGIIAVQCFHWFANQKALDEIYRVLEDKSSFVLVWNTNDYRVAWVDRAIKTYQKYFTDEPNFYTYQWKESLDNYPGFELIENKILPGQKHQGDIDFIIGHFSSVSTVQKLESQQKETVLNEIRQIIRTRPNITDLNCIQLPMFTEIQHYRKVNIKN